MPGGGVCAVLDYEVEAMAEYVAEMTTRLTSGNGHASSELRKFVSQILSSTRLPSTTILLGMNYLSKRLNMLNQTAEAGRMKMPDGQIWRMLTVALLLGSKFLDDNTFQNRSWAEVSGIPVRELNTMENEWMYATRWNLYVNIDRSEDYNAWLKNWDEWSKNKKRHQTIARQSVIENELALARARSQHAQSTWHKQQVAEYERLSRMKRTEQAQQQPPAYRSRDNPWPAYDQQASTWPTSPLTPPDSGYGTPDHLEAMVMSSQANNDWFSHNRSTYGRHQPPPQYSQAASNEAYRTGALNVYGYRQYGHNIWEQSPPTCRCHGCLSSPHPNQPWCHGAPSYSQQMVN